MMLSAYYFSAFDLALLLLSVEDMRVWEHSKFKSHYYMDRSQVFSLFPGHTKAGSFSTDHSSG